MAGIFSSGPACARELPLKLEVVQTGIYEVGYTALGLSVPVPSQGLQLSRQGLPVAIQLEDGGDGVFGPGDTIRFYGRAVSRSDRLYKYTGTAVYRLEQLPAGQQGLRMSVEQDAVCPCQSPVSFRDTLHAEENRIYWQQLPNGDGVDHWFWSGELRVGSLKTFTVTPPGLVAGTAAIRVHLHGSTSGSHLTRISVNGNVAGDFLWPTGDGAVPHTITVQLPSGLLTSGQNTVTVESRNAGATTDGIYVDWIELDYDRAYSAVNEELSFSVAGSGAQEVVVQGFADPWSVKSYDLSDPERPRPLVSGDATFLIDPAGTPGPFIAVASNAVLHPVVDAFSPDTLRSSNNGADYIIITDPTLSAAVEPLRARREAQGLRSRVVEMGSIYDEFADGYADPDAIKAFLTYAYDHWQSPRPRYVLMLGDANFDYRDYFGNHEPSLVPVHLIETPGFGEVPSDNWFVTVSGGDPYPDMWIGRIPASTPAEVTMVVDKIIQYEMGMGGEWPHRIIVASGDNKPQFPHSQQRFVDGTNHWLSLMPAGYDVVSIAPSAVDVSQYINLRGSFTQTLNGVGVGFVSYFGHGAVDAWLASDTNGIYSSDALELLRSADISSLENVRGYPFVAAFNCLNGLFSLPARMRSVNASGQEVMNKSLVSLAEALMFLPGKGAIGMMAATSLAYSSEQVTIGDALFERMFDDSQSQKILGEIVGLAKVQAVRDQGVDPQNLDIMTLIGDPAMRLAIRGNSVAAASGAGSGDAGGGGVLGGGAFVLVWAARRFRRRSDKAY
ncbi:MAG: hypothetical protein GC138_07690 [Gammaproteobacteria bacterium]|nr:hypothetical protein [Gammaproteobacteria bacterium]